MGRWLHRVALVIIAAVLANAQCSAACLVSDSPAAAEHSACCAEHHPSPEHSHQGCQHRHSALKNAELSGTDLYQASAVYLHSTDFVVAANVSKVFAVGPIALAFRLASSRGTPPKRSPLLVLSVLRI